MLLALLAGAALAAVQQPRAVLAARAVGGDGWREAPEKRGPSESSESLLAPTGSGACDVTSTRPICFAGQRPAVVPAAVAAGLVGHWTFDEDSAYDSSGNGNHCVSDILHGPSPAGGGHSAFFHKSFAVVPNTQQLQLDDFSYTFWVFLLEDSEAQADDSPLFCPLLRKGIYAPKAQEFANAPAILFNHRTGQLRGSLTTTATTGGNVESVDSNARLMPGRWLHVALVHHAARGVLLLYANGVLDAIARVRGSVLQNRYPLYVGGDPFLVEQCRHAVYIDELRVYGHAVAPHELQAEAAPALAGVDPSFVRLGCRSCSLPEALRACPRGRHICSSLELHTGGYQVARSLGWLSGGTGHVWTHAAVVKARSSIGAGTPLLVSQSGLGLCCEDEG